MKSICAVTRLYAAAFVVLMAGCAAEGGMAGSPSSFLIVGATVVDGTGAPSRVTNVRVLGDRIAAIGGLKPERGEMVVEADGLVLAPGFIDTHSHHDGGLTETPEALGAVSQGITTIIVGQDGGSPLPLSDFFGEVEATSVAVNVAAYAGHNSLRGAVMGDDFRRPAGDQEVQEMADLLRRELEAGAIGLSTGLEYDPGIYSETSEVLALAHVTADAGGRYISHMRSEDRAFFEALDELLTIGRETGMPVQVGHIKLAMKSLWGRADEVIAILDSARAEGIDVTADIYPYEFWQSTMTVLFPDREFTREAAQFALEELAPPEGMLIAAFDPDPSYVGWTLAEIAAARGRPAVDVYLELIAEVAAIDGRESVIARSMVADDIGTFLSWPHTNVSSDGSLAGRHPRGFGAFTRVLALHVRERGDVTLEEAIRRMTSLAAEHMGLVNRGTLVAGAFADFVLFDPRTVTDRATPESPNEPSVGIAGVWVNGEQVYGSEGTTGARPGRILRKTAR
jgi:N-acyl-D-amino-acid deacylase